VLEEIVPLTVKKVARARRVVEVDEGPRRDTALERLAGLRAWWARSARTCGPVVDTGRGPDYACKQRRHMRLEGSMR